MLFSAVSINIVVFLKDFNIIQYILNYPFHLKLSGNWLIGSEHKITRQVPMSVNFFNLSYRPVKIHRYISSATENLPNNLIQYGLRATYGDKNALSVGTDTQKQEKI